MRRVRATARTPRVTVACVADTYSNECTRVVAFTFPNGTGGLIRFWEHDATGETRIEIARIDPGVRVILPGVVDLTIGMDGAAVPTIARQDTVDERGTRP